MTEPIDLAAHARKDEGVSEEGDEKGRAEATGTPSNAVYERVGDRIYRAAQDGVRRGLPPQDIIREILLRHDVRLNVGELRLLLATRRAPKQPSNK